MFKKIGFVGDRIIFYQIWAESLIINFIEFPRYIQLNVLIVKGNINEYI